MGVRSAVSRLSRVVTRDTGRDITAQINRAAEQYGFHAVGLLGGAIAESDLIERAARERTWPDVSYGLWQPAVKWLGPEVPDLSRDPDGTVQDTPANRETARAFCSDAARLIDYVAPRYKTLLERWGSPVEAWCRWNSPSLPGEQNPNRVAYERGVAAAEVYRSGDEGRESLIEDLRGRLPAIGQYNTRPLDAIRGITLHYTAGPLDQTAEQIAAYQTSAEAAGQTGEGVPFPAIAYTILVTGDGIPNLCHDLDRRTWHSAAIVDGLSRNLTRIGICFTGVSEPNAAQIAGLAEAIDWCERQLGRQLPIEGHRDAPYATKCPGSNWPSWRARLEEQLAEWRGTAPPAVDVANGFVVGSGFRTFLEQHPEWGKARMDEMALVGGAYLWTTPTAQHPKGGLLIYRSWLNEVRPLAWE